MLGWLRTRLGLAWPWAPKTLCQRGEAAASQFLKQLGYKIVARSDRSKIGEIDLVAVDGRTVVFVEVKTLQSQDHGHPSDRVDTDKQRRLTRLALAYLKRHRLLENPARFDIVAITWPDSRGQPKIEHIQSAFEATGFDGMFS